MAAPRSPRSSTAPAASSPSGTPAPPSPSPLVGVVMGSRSDWDVMSYCASTLDSLGVPHEVRILSAHRTPDALIEWLASAEKRGVEVFIAAAGGAAHLAGVVASRTLRPVLGVPMESASLKGLDSLLSTVQMPAGIPVASFAIGKPGAVNAAIAAAQILAITRPALLDALHQHRSEQSRAVLLDNDPRKTPSPRA